MFRDVRDEKSTAIHNRECRIKRFTDKLLLGLDSDEISRAICGQGYRDQGQKIQGIYDARD
jgi:hypothetical protein